MQIGEAFLSDFYRTICGEEMKVTRTILCKGCGERIYPGEDDTIHRKHWNQHMTYNPKVSDAQSETKGVSS